MRLRFTALPRRLVTVNPKRGVSPGPLTAALRSFASSTKLAHDHLEPPRTRRNSCLLFNVTSGIWPKVYSTGDAQVGANAKLTDACGLLPGAAIGRGDRPWSGSVCGNHGVVYAQGGSVDRCVSLQTPLNSGRCACWPDCRNHARWAEKTVFKACGYKQIAHFSQCNAAIGTLTGIRNQHQR